MWCTDGGMLLCLLRMLNFSLQGTRLANGGSSGAAQVGACALQAGYACKLVQLCLPLHASLGTQQQLLCEPS